MITACNFIKKELHYKWFYNSFTIFLRIGRPASDKFIIYNQIRTK